MPRSARALVWLAWSSVLWCVVACKTQETSPVQASRHPAVALEGNEVTDSVAPSADVAAQGAALVVTSGAPDVFTSSGNRRQTRYAIVVSVDGLAPRFLEELLRQGKAPNFARLQQRGAWTHEARTDKTHTITLPNHTCMITGLPVSPAAGLAPHRAHRYTDNAEPWPNVTLHATRDIPNGYTPSMFDVAHDHGLSTAMFASKSKFVIYSQTYNDAGGPDEVGPDNGRKKIDTVLIERDPTLLVAAFINRLKTAPPNLTFLHFGSTDAMGHGVGWGSPAYLAALQQVDALLGRIMSTLETEPFADASAIIITADHGGTGTHHDDSDDIRNFTIPFYVMAPGVAPGDAYQVFKKRFAPGPVNPEHNAPEQPLRNGDAGNVALELLGLPPIPDSVMQGAGLVLN